MSKKRNRRDRRNSAELAAKVKPSLEAVRECLAEIADDKAVTTNLRALDKCGIPIDLHQLAESVFRKTMSDSPHERNRVNVAKFIKTHDLNVARVEIAADKQAPQVQVNVQQCNGEKQQDDKKNEPSKFKQQMAGMLASMLPPSIVDAAMLERDGEHDNPAP